MTPLNSLSQGASLGARHQCDTLLGAMSALDEAALEGASSCGLADGVAQALAEHSLRLADTVFVEHFMAVAEADQQAHATLSACCCTDAT